MSPYEVVEMVYKFVLVSCVISCGIVTIGLPVLGGFRKEEIEEINKAIENASEAVLEVINNGVYSAMNRFN